MPADTLLTDPAPPTRLAALLAECDGALSQAALAEARSIGAEATSAVVAALLGSELTSPSDDWTPLAAVYLATELRLAGTVPSLVSCVLQSDLGDELWEAALNALRAIGAPAVQPLALQRSRRTPTFSRARASRTHSSRRAPRTSAF